MLWPRKWICNRLLLGFLYSAWSPNIRGCNPAILIPISLKINYQQLGLDKSKVEFRVPFILRYQDEKRLASLENLDVPAKKGYLIVMEDKN